MVPLPTVERVRDYFLWRQEDAHRNALNAHCYWLLRKHGVSKRAATSQLEGQSTAYKNELLFQNGINFDKLPAWQKRGIGLYWKTEEKIGFNPVTGQQTTALRRKLTEDYELPLREAYANMVEGILIDAEKDI
jgi:tRNA(His) 5'-end guanylyltransferase